MWSVGSRISKIKQYARLWQINTSCHSKTSPRKSVADNNKDKTCVESIVKKNKEGNAVIKLLQRQHRSFGGFIFGYNEYEFKVRDDSPFTY